MYGWHGRLLRVDLTHRKASAEAIDPRVSKDFIGGRGVAIRYLYDELKPGTDPLGEDNRLLLPQLLSLGQNPASAGNHTAAA